MRYNGQAVVVCEECLQEVPASQVVFTPFEHAVCTFCTTLAETEKAYEYTDVEAAMWLDVQLDTCEFGSESYKNCPCYECTAQRKFDAEVGVVGFAA